ncbi:MAG: toxin-antitoxin system YwqK family antitoxin [Phycisphaerales bacterium]|nr:MAG: toxin-antitoxin system YwqK family antitoxin [Phycisphaerales bacterium]
MRVVMLLAMLTVGLAGLTGCEHAGQRTDPAEAQTAEAPSRSVDKQETQTAKPASHVVEELWPDGRPRLRKGIMTGPDGRQVNHGKYERWFDNGQKEYEATFIQGNKSGLATRWHNNGQKWTEEHYFNGQRHGISRTWDQAGNLRKQEEHLKGKPHGVWTVWYADGRIKWRAEFDRGKPKS